MIRWRMVFYRDHRAKADDMMLGALRDSRAPYIRWLATFFIPLVQRDELKGAQAIFRHVRDNVIYANDPGIEVLDDATVTFARGHGDCDAKTRAFIALCIACGLVAYVEPIFRGDLFPHVRGRVVINGLGHLVADTTILNSELGVLPTGRIITNR